MPIPPDCKDGIKAPMNISGNIMQTARSTPPKDVKPENMVFVNKAVELYMN